MPQYNADKIANLIAQRNLRMLDIGGIVENGSTVYGVTSPSTGDDLDLTGVYFDTFPTVLAGGKAKTHSIRTALGGAKSSKDDIDLVLHPLRKFASLLAGGNPSILTVVFSPLVHHERRGAWTAVQRLHRRTASKLAGKAFLGYLTQQIERWTGKRGQKNVSRPDLVAKYGYDTKYAYHAIRLGWQGIDYLRTGYLELPLPEHQRQYLLDVREGRVSEDRAIALAESLRSQLPGEIEHSKLPERPNHEGLWNDVARMYRNHWQAHGDGT